METMCVPAYETSSVSRQHVSAPSSCHSCSGALGQQELSSDVAERLENQLRANFGYWEKDPWAPLFELAPYLAEHQHTI